MGASRWTYNQCLNGIKNNNVPKTKKDLRDHCINSKSNIVQDNVWCRDVPYDIRNEGMADLLKAYKTCFSVGKQFDIKFKSKKENKDSIVIHSKNYKRKKGPYSMIKKLKSAEPLPTYLDYDARLIKDALNEYWLCIPIRIPVKPLDNQGGLHAKEKVAAIDPGVRTFATIYDSDGVGIEVGKGDIGRIYRLGCVVDKLQSKWDKKETRHKERYHLKKAAKKIRKKIKNLVKEVHDKLILFLCFNYEIILLPTFNTKQMIFKRKRRINSKTARNIITWSHFSFRQRLLNKIREFPNVKVKMVTEEYTSKTCGQCGTLNQSLGAKKVFSCGKCDYEANRDLNAARNILIKSINESW